MAATGVLKTYYRLTKPGIIYGNAVTTAAGFLLASQGHPDAVRLVAALVGISLVIASACVANNFIDRGIDQHMARTRRRALVTGKVSGRAALIYAAVLGLLGTGILAVFTNALTVALGLIGYVFYVAIYGWAKRNTVHGTVVGSISGAIPPAAGYVAVSGQLDIGAWLLFLMLVAWQMPHFYAIAMYRLNDYKQAGLPVLPAVKGSRATKIQMVAYIPAYILAVIGLTFFGHASITFMVVGSCLGAWWLARGLAGFNTDDDVRWARRMFLFSLIVLTVPSMVLWLTGILP